VLLRLNIWLFQTTYWWKFAYSQISEKLALYSDTGCSPDTTTTADILS